MADLFPSKCVVAFCDGGVHFVSEALGSGGPTIPECYLMSSGRELTPRHLAR